MRLILASASPRRREILSALRIPFEVIVPELEELTDGVPEEVVVENARRKAAAGLREAEEAAESAIALGVDTEVVLDGPSPYDLTAELLAWAAVRASQQGMASSGVLGPVDAFGLDALEGAAAAIGLQRSP